MTTQDYYKQMWEDIGTDARKSYLDIKFRPTYRIGLTNYLRERTILDLLEPNITDRILDIGCASGRQIFRISDRIKEGHGVDISESFIEQAEAYKIDKNVSNVCFKVAVIEGLPFDYQYFDKIICAEVMEHVVDKDVALNEIRRVLKPGGRLIITVPNLNADGTWWGRLLRLTKVRKFEPMKIFSQKELKKHGDSHVREFTAISLKKWLGDSGFEVERITTVSFIDGPYMDFILKIPLHIGFLRESIILFENILTRLDLHFGRHLVVRASLLKTKL